MRRPTLLALTLLLSFLGILDAWYLAQHALTDTALSCGIGIPSLSGCNTVAQSTYSHFFGVPLGIYGLIFYAGVFVVSGILYAKSVRRLSQLLFSLSIVGLLFSIYFVGLQLFVINAVCIYCFASFFISLGIFLLTYKLIRTDQVQLPPLM